MSCLLVNRILITGAVDVMFVGESDTDHGSSRCHVCYKKGL
jgi:hypothetical protein